MGRGTDILVLFVGEDVQSDHVDLGVAVLAGLGGGHFHDFAGTTLFLEKRKFLMFCFLQTIFYGYTEFTDLKFIINQRNIQNL